ncbi:MAG: lipid IV(A) 3-deoxy-D-manno-octulosonic acid transferase [Gammaproteobacteria bacterium]
MRTLYSAAFYLLIPLILLRLRWRGIKAPLYRRRWAERFAIYGNLTVPGVIWFHAVSVGEAEALFPLVRQIQKQHPQNPLLITTTTPTGSARIKSVLKDSVIHVYLPYDLPCVVNRFMRCFQPKLAVIMETEIWPNLFAACGKRRIPLFLVNARLTEKSVRGYLKIPALIRPALAQVDFIAAQSTDDVTRFIKVGAPAECVENFGNMKFDVEISQDTVASGLRLKNELFNARFVWLIASTHKDEEIIFINLYKTLKLKIPELLMVLVPRHPERFTEVEKLCVQNRLSLITRTSGSACSVDTDVFLVDTMGELKMFYGAADIAFVGGSMVPRGGHNILEPAAMGVPVMFGPYMVNFQEIAEGLLAQNAALQCRTNDEIYEAVIRLHSDYDFRDALVKKSKAFKQNNEGAIAKIVALINQCI